MKALRIFGLSWISLLITGCVTTQPQRPTEAGFSAIMKKWEGQPLSHLVDVMGYPKRELQSPQGNPVYEYESSKDVRSSVSTYSHTYGDVTFSTSSGGSVSKLECRVWFELSEKTVQKVTWRGDDCLAPEAVVIPEEQLAVETATSELERANASGESECKTKGGMWGVSGFERGATCDSAKRERIPVAADRQVQDALKKLHAAEEKRDAKDQERCSTTGGRWVGGACH